MLTGSYSLGVAETPVAREVLKGQGSEFRLSSLRLSDVGVNSSGFGFWGADAEVSGFRVQAEVSWGSWSACKRWSW